MLRWSVVCGIGTMLAAPRAAASTPVVSCPSEGVERVRPDSTARAATTRGSGTFTVGLSRGRTVDVYYHCPRTLTNDSRVLMVLPGAGRNAWDYRDHWIEAAERFGVLVLSPHYPEREYPDFWNYNLAGMIADVRIDAKARAMVDYRITTDPARWLFADLEQVFDHARRTTGLTTSRYDVFGHSAGGQLAHRLALFARGTLRADRVLAANSGWYTVPDDSARFPFGLIDAPLVAGQMRSAFARRLVVFLGGADDANETRGDLVRSKDTDRQGLHRLARGQHFFEHSKQYAARQALPFRWTLHVVPDVGHDARRMSVAAADYLYRTGAAPVTPAARP